jgi:ribonuclease P protein component
MAFVHAWQQKVDVWLSKDVGQKAVRVSAPKNTFPRSFRLKSSKDFQRIYQHPKKFRGRFFTLLVRENTLDYPRLGVVITKKNVKLAVTRNRIKRMIKESFRRRIRDLKNIDIVIIVQREAPLITKDQLQTELEKQWQKLIAYYQSLLS